MFISGYDAGILAGRDSRELGIPLLAKPFSPRDLMRTLGALLGSSA